MNILNKLTLKHLKMNKKRTIVSIVGIILSTALMVGVGLLISSMRDSMIREMITTGGDYHAKVNELDVSKKDILEKNKNIDNYSFYYLSGISNDEKFLINNYKYLYIQAGNESYLQNVKLDKGNLPNNDSEIVISNSLAVNKKYKIGDTISIDLGNRYYEGENIDIYSNYYKEEEFRKTITKEYKIVGIYDGGYAFGNDYYQFMIMYTKENNYKGSANFYIKYKNINDTMHITENMIVKNLGMNPGSIIYNSGLLGMYGVSGYGNINSFLSTFLSTFLTIISIACIIVIYNSFAISVMERKKQFGLFSSIGATKRQIIRSVFFEATIVGILGIVLGILAAYLGIGITLYFLDNLLLGIFSEGFKLTTYPLFVIIPVIFMVLVVYISAYLPARRASKISPIEVIRQNDDIKVNKNKIRTSKITQKLFGVEGEIALKNIKRNKKKYRITIVSLFISIVTFIAFSSYLTYGVQTAGDYIGTINYDIAASSMYADDKDIDNLKNLMKQTEVEDYTYINQLDVTLKTNAFYFSKEMLDEYFKYDSNANEELMNNMTVISMNKEKYDEYKKQLGITSNRPILYNKYKTVSYKNNDRRIIARDIYKKSEDMVINLCTNQDASSYVSETCKTYMTLSNFVYVDELPYMLEEFQGMPSGVLIVDDETLNKIRTSYDGRDSDDLRYSVGVFIKASEYKRLDQLGEDYDGMNYYYTNIKEQFKLQMNLILAIKILLYGFIALITLIGITSVFNTINTSISLRRKEFSVLRSIGLTPKGFNKMIWYESLIFGLKSLLYALPVGLVLSLLIFSQMNSLVEFSYVPPYSAIIVAIIGVFVVIVLTMIYATKKIKHENILDSIRDENI